MLTFRRDFPLRQLTQRFVVTHFFYGKSTPSTGLYITIVIVNSRFRKLEKSREQAYSQALIQNKIDRQRVRSRESGRQAGRQSDGYGGWCLEFIHSLQTFI